MDRCGRLRRSCCYHRRVCFVPAPALALALWLCVSSAAAFNLDTDNPFVYSGPQGSYFGYSVDFYKPDQTQHGRYAVACDEDWTPSCGSLWKILGYRWFDLVLLMESRMRHMTCIVRERQLRHYGHVARFPEGDPARRILIVGDQAKGSPT
ncbi:ITA8 protein, partial [Polypterus senegalus]